MPRTIIVKGVGELSVSPDSIVISMTLETQDMQYDKTMDLSAEYINDLNLKLQEIGFEKKSLKTINFRVRTEHESVKQKNGVYKSIFSGYVCLHNLKIEFDFDHKKLAQTLSAISKSIAKPLLSVSFTVKNPAAVKKELLISATKNAKEKAEILCSASGVELGTLLSINYDWNEISVTSNTRYSMLQDGIVMSDSKISDIEIEPEDIDVSDSAAFVWEIK